jgi:hypothetical protein
VYAGHRLFRQQLYGDHLRHHHQRAHWRVASCTAATASSGNSYTATTCNTITTGPTRSRHLFARATAASGNQLHGDHLFHRDYRANRRGFSCTPVTASSAGNSYTATTCKTVTTGPTGVSPAVPR